MTDFHSAIALRRCKWVERADRSERSGTKWFRTAEKVETNRCNPGHDRNPCIIRSRFRMGTWEFSARLFNPLCWRCSILGMTVRLPPVGDDREQDVVALLWLPLALFDRLDPLGEMPLVGEERFARRGGDDLTAAAGDRRQSEILAQVGFEDHVRRHAVRARHGEGRSSLP